MPVFKKMVLCLLLSAMVATAVVPAAGIGTVASAAGLTSFSETTEAGIPGTLNSVYGTLSTTTPDQLAEKDQAYLTMTSASNGTNQEASFWTDVTLNSTNAYIVSLSVGSTIYTSITGSTEKIYLYNYNTSVYDQVASGSAGTSDTDLSYLTEGNSNISKYVSSSKLLRIKIVVTNTSSFTAYFDYMSIVYEYQPQVTNRIAASYNMDNATLEYGTISANNATYLKNRDAVYYSVASASNKVAWNSAVTLNQKKENIKTLIINYSGNYSASCNNTWLSLWNYQTGNWETVTNFASGTAVKTVKWVISDSTFINKFVSEFNDVKIRLYNSGSSSFTRNADYLNVTVYYDTANSVKNYSPDTLLLDYGTISSGSVTNLSAFDNSPVVISSDTYNRIAWKCKTTIDIDRQYVKSLTVMTRVKSSTSINNLNFALWNYTTGNWAVFNEQTGSTVNENLLIMLTDPDDLANYISSTGEIQARLYNSASAVFTRSTDVLTFCVEYGSVGTFTFAQLSDIHEFAGGSNFQSIISDLNTNIRPDFTVISGDITDHGTPDQYNQYLTDLAALNGTKYTSTGNHDVRWWNSNGKNDWKNTIGSLYYSFNYKGVHFVILDSTVNLELDEKFGKAQLDWLTNDLSAISTDMPVVFFAHHPFYMYNNVTGKDELLKLVKNYNVVAYMSGHQHYYGTSVENGVLWDFISDVKDDPVIPFCTIKVTPNKLYIYKQQESDHTSSLWLTAPMTNKRKSSMTITDATAQTNGDVSVSVTIDKAPDGVSTVQASVDNYGSWTTLTQNGSIWTGTVSISGYSPAVPYGKHFIGVNMTDNTGKVWKEYKDYEWSGGDAYTKWTFQTGDIIQSSPTYFNGAIYVGSEDGKLYAVNDSDGSLKWSYTSGDQVISKPAVYQGATKNLIIFGSHDNKLYALNADTGAFEWSYTTGGSVISNPLVDYGVVYFGSGDKYIYALNASDGTLRWRYSTNGLMRQTPVVSNGKLYAYVRDTYIWYALNTSDGSLYWRGNAGTDESMFVCGDVKPLLAGNKLWCIDAQNTRAGYLNPDTGSLTWYSSTITEASARSMATDGTRIFYPSNEGRQIYALNISDNSQAWYKDLRAGSSDSDLQSGQIDSGLIYDGGILYHVADRGRITGIDPANGNIKFVYDAVGYPERSLWSTPEVYNKTVYIGGLDGKLYAVKYNGN